MGQTEQSNRSVSAPSTKPLRLLPDAAKPFFLDRQAVQQNGTQPLSSGHALCLGEDADLDHQTLI